MRNLFDYLLILNAGSSSLKFAAYRRSSSTDLDLAVRGQVESIGNAPQMSARDGLGAVLAVPPVDRSVSDCSGAVNVVVDWLRPRLAGGLIVGVGHRVVHGGSRYVGPAIVTPNVLADLRSFVSLAPLHQPYNLA